MKDMWEDGLCPSLGSAILSPSIAPVAAAPVWSLASVRAEAAALLRIGAPLMVTQLTQMVMGFFDTVMMGRVGPDELAAVAIGTGLWHSLFLMALGVLMALSPSVAQLQGAGQRAAIAPLVRQALWLGLVLGLLCALGLRHLQGLLWVLGIESGLVPLITAYLDALSWGMVPVCVFMVLRLFSEGIGRTRPVLLVSLFGLLVNLVANYVLIFGHWGFPALGARGCGLATALGMAVLPVAMLVLVMRDRGYRDYALLRAWAWPHGPTLWPLLVLGVPIGIGLFLETAVFAAVALLLGMLGAVAAAAHQVALSVASITFMVPLGLSMATTVRVGHAIGRGDAQAARRTGFIGIGLCAGFMVLMAVAMFAGSAAIARFYSEDMAVVTVATGLLQLAALFQLSDGLQVGALGALRGLKDTRLPLLIVLVAYWLIAFPLAWWLGLHQGLGPSGPWIGLIAGLTTAAVLLNLRFGWLSARWGRSSPVHPDRV